MISIYYFLLSLVLIIFGPFLLFFKKARAGLMQKFGFVPKAIKERTSALARTSPRIWFHAVSVGEFNAVLPLIEEFRARHPEYRIFISNTTATGHAQAKSKAASFAELFFFPFDLPFCTAAWLDLIRPELIAIVETERWPGFMEQCKQRKIDVVLINGRLSPRSYESYKRYGFFFSSVLSKFSALAVQSEAEKTRFLSLLGDKKVPMTVCGNIKLDGAKPCSDAEKIQLRQSLNVREDELVVVAGSTHEGEESAFLTALKELDCDFRLILVPRHPERFQRVANLIENSSFALRRFTKGEKFSPSTNAADQVSSSTKEVYLLDTIGQLSKFYSIADIAFVGGTLANIGGHNLVEPCIYKTPVICGPYIHKTRDLFLKMTEANALVLANDEKELKSELAILLDSHEKRKELGENGFQFLAQSQGALAKTLALLEEYLGCRDQENWDRGDCRGNSKDQSTVVKVETVGGVRR